MTRTTLERREIEVPASPAQRRRARAGVAILTTALAPAAWGTTYLTTTELLPPGRPLLAGTLRALPAGLVLAAATKRRPVGAWWAKAFVLGTLNIGGFFALLFVAAYRLPGASPPRWAPSSRSSPPASPPSFCVSAFDAT